jgi:uncharacterized damage-inducible protein DinB
MPGRRLPMEIADERGTLLHWLDFHREGLLGKVEDLGAEPLHRQLVVSGSTLAGIVEHVAGVEDAWVQVAFLGRGRTEPTPLGDEADGDALAACYRSAIARTDAALQGCDDLDARAAVRTYGPRDPMTLRWILTHLVQETARHHGHVDILRELIDGKVGI